jgi:hypothetical protein
MPPAPEALEMSDKLIDAQLANRTFADADALARAIPDAVARLNHER